MDKLDLSARIVQLMAEGARITITPGFNMPYQVAMRRQEGSKWVSWEGDDVSELLDLISIETLNTNLPR